MFARSEESAENFRSLSLSVPLSRFCAVASSYEIAVPRFPPLPPLVPSSSRPISLRVPSRDST